MLGENDDESFSPTMSFHSSDSESVSLVDSDEEADVEEGSRVDDVDVIHLKDQFGMINVITLIIIWLSCIGMGSCTQTKVLGTL